MNLFITGASGFVGGATASAMAHAHMVRAMSRSPASDDKLRALGVTPVRCDLNTVAAEHLATSEVVIHAAAFVEQWGTRAQFWSANVEGTSRMLEAAQRAGVKRFIHIGTEAALFRGQPMRDIDETYPYPERTPYLYSETKAEAERRVLAANRATAGGMTTLSLRPRLIWGPGDQTILPALKQMVELGRFMWIDRGRAQTSTTHIHNLVHAIGLALERGQGGHAYFITDGPTTTVREFLTALLATAGITPPDRSLPSTVARTMAAMVEGSWRLLGRESAPPLTRFAADIMACDCTIRIDKAVRELGYQPQISVADGLAALSVASGVA